MVLASSIARPLPEGTDQAQQTCCAFSFGLVLLWQMVKPNATLKNKDEHKGLKLDRSDIENIKNALDLYDRMNPRGKVRILNYVENGKKKQSIEFCNISDHLDYMRKYKVKDQSGIRNLKKNTFDVPIRLQLSIPPSLEAWLNKGYPKLFTDVGQTQQFLRAFPKFDLTR